MNHKSSSNCSDEHQNVCVCVCVCVLVCSDGDCGYDMFETDSEEEEEEVKDMTENNIIPKKKTAFQVKWVGGGGVSTLTLIYVLFTNDTFIFELFSTLSSVAFFNFSFTSSLIYCNTHSCTFNKVIFIKLLKSSRYGILKSSWSSQVTFIYIALLTLLIVSWQLYSIK